MLRALVLRPATFYFYWVRREVQCDPAATSGTPRTPPTGWEEKYNAHNCLYASNTHRRPKQRHVQGLRDHRLFSGMFDHFLGSLHEAPTRRRLRQKRKKRSPQISARGMPAASKHQQLAGSDLIDSSQ